MTTAIETKDPHHLFDHGGWHLRLFANQCYLGRVQLNLLRPCEGSLAALTDTEWSALRQIIQAYEAALDQLFKPDRYNIKQLGNQWRQTHVHLIPRYAEPRAFGGHEISDMRFGGDPYPEPDAPELGDALYDLARLIAEGLRKELGYQTS